MKTIVIKGELIDGVLRPTEPCPIIFVTCEVSENNFIFTIDERDNS